MTAEQKIIKGFAIGLAVIIIISIVSVAVSALLSVASWMGLIGSDYDLLGEMSALDGYEGEDISALDIEVAQADLVIKVGDELKVESNSKYVSVNQKNGKLVIEENRPRWFSETGDIVVYVPKDKILESVTLEEGAGELTIEALTAKKLTLEIGAGSALIESINVLEKADIEGGAGKLVISSGSVNALDFEIGVGKAELCLALTGRSAIETGIGGLELDIIGDADDYTVRADNGIGSIVVDGKALSDGNTVGSGENIIDINNGIGSVSITFSE